MNKKNIAMNGAERSRDDDARRKSPTVLRFSFWRVFFYILGLMCIALGVTLNTKTVLGISPVISVAYNIAYILGFTFSIVTFVYYIFLILVQWLLLGQDFRPIQMLQVISSLITSLFIQLFDSTIPEFQGMPLRISMLLLAIVITGTGILLTVRMELIPNPADGLADAIGIKTKKGLGFGKNLLDFTCISIALVLGFAVTRGILGIGIGTVLTMIFTGRVVALERPLGERLTAFVLRKEGRE